MADLNTPKLLNKELKYWKEQSFHLIVSFLGRALYWMGFSFNKEKLSERHFLTCLKTRLPVKISCLFISKLLIRVFSSKRVRRRKQLHKENSFSFFIKCFTMELSVLCGYYYLWTICSLIVLSMTLPTVILFKFIVIQ